MRNVLWFVLLAAICVAGAMWVAALPGSVSAVIAGTTFEASTPVALALLALVFLLIYVVLRLVAWIIGLPGRIRRARRERNRVRGDAAVTRTLVALAANDGGAARREAERGRRLLGETPLTLLLAAQADRQAGRENDAGAVFKRLAEREDGKLLGLRGLLRQAMEREDWVAATALAQQAEAAHPGAAWLTEERQRVALRTGQYREALRLIGPGRRGEGDGGARAALGVLAADEEPDPKAALRLSKQAFEAAPALGPAAVAYARRLRAGGRARSALEVLQRSWSLLPQPEVAEAYLAPISDKLARHRAAADLVSVNPAHPDSALLLARTALEAGLTGEARRHAEAAQKAGLNDSRLWVTLADIAEADGDAAAAQDALRHIAGAPAAPGWRCGNCGTRHGEWQAVCDACGVPGKVSWGAREPDEAMAIRASAPAVIEGLG